MRDRLIEMINEQAALGTEGRIVLKMNGLVDTTVIDALYAASKAGVRVDLLVRSICCLRPGVQGLSREHSACGRSWGGYLEHSRLWVFGGKTTPAKYFIGSADVMPRNLDRRIEVVTPVDDPALTERLEAIIDACFAEDAVAWHLEPDGHWFRPLRGGVDSQTTLREIALTRGSRRTDVVPARVAPLRLRRGKRKRSK